MYYRTPLLILLGLIALAVIFAGCSSPAATPSATPGQGNPAQASVQIKDFAFSPQDVHVAKGGIVTWTNLDSIAHTVSFNGVQSQVLNKGDTYSKTFNETGTFDYICGIHTYMTGKVVAE